MRVGSNPEKFNKEISNNTYHRVVVPVFIPHFEGYFKNALQILELNLESLLLTVHDKTRITIYNNNSIKAVKEYIDNLYNKHEIIDQVFHSKENLGKINAILASVKGNLEPLITITDSDVFFKHDWQKQVESIFQSFPTAGMVSPVPNSVAYKAFTANNWYMGIIGKASIRFEDVKDPLEMKKFELSLGKEVTLYSEGHLEKYLVLSNSSGKAVMGSGHFVATLRRKVFDEGSHSPAFLKIQGGVENKFIDIPNEKLGFLRLSTLGNYAFHLGNVSEKWMIEEFKKLNQRKPNPPNSGSEFLQSERLNILKMNIGKAIRKFVLSRALKKRYFEYLGLKNGQNY